MNKNKKIKDFKQALEKAFQKPLPGLNAQLKLSPPFRDLIPPGKHKKDAAVLILIFPRGDSISTVFIKRNNYDGPHSGQISFPGGKFDKTDPSLEYTAIREANEEIGTSLTSNNLIGRLSSLYIPISRFDVSPYVGIIDYEPNFIPNSHEVQYIIELPLKTILQKNDIDAMDISFENNIIAVPCFNYNNNQIWGATAMMLNEFISLLRGADIDLSSL